MEDIIHLLPEALANQIAAGEVVQRPASAVKELLENALDAGATEITLIVKDAGKQLIQVVDNGSGMSDTDARMSFERHATSKITKTDDLFDIHTFGFRGEALASIAAVAQVELKSRKASEAAGTRILIDGSEVKLQEPCACPVGTSISIRNLFFNVPARRAFLKSNAVEMRHILEEFQRVALSQPSVAFNLYQGDLETYRLPPAKLAKRIVGLFNKNYNTKLVACSEELDHVQVSGYIGKPEAAKKTRGEQFFFVNNRYIRHPYLHHAVNKAFAGLIPENHHPFYVLFLEMDASRVDVNVHPTKHEVKFDDERTLYAVVHAAAKQALASQGIAPSIDFDIDANFTTSGSLGVNLPEGHRPFEPQNIAGAGGQVVERQVLPSRLNNSSTTTGLSNFNSRSFQPNRQASNWESLYSGLKNTIEPAIPAPSQKQAFQVRNQYILCQVHSGLLMVDQQAASERIFYERFLESIGKRNGSVQRLLFPKTLELTAPDVALLQAHQPELQALGFELKLSDTRAEVVGIPNGLQNLDEQEALEELVEQLKHNANELSLQKEQIVARTLAKRAAVKSGQQLQVEQMLAMVEQLFSCENPHQAPDGSKTLFMLNMEQLAAFFDS